MAPVAESDAASAAAAVLFRSAPDDSTAVLVALVVVGRADPVVPPLDVRRARVFVVAARGDVFDHEHLVVAVRLC